MSREPAAMLDTGWENWQLSRCRNVGAALRRGAATRTGTGGDMSAGAGFSKGVAWLALGNWTEQSVNFIVFVLLARLLGAESFGLLAMASVFVVFSEFLVRESLSEVLIATKAPSEADFNAVFWLLLGLALVLALTVGMAAPLIARFYGEPQVAPLIHVLMATVPMIAVTAVPVAILRRALRFRELALRAIAGVVAGGVVGVGMALAGYGVWSLAGQRVATVATNVALAWFAVGWRPGFRTSGAHLGRVARFGGKVLGLRAAELAATQVPALIIGAYLGAVTLGLYTVAWRVVELGSFLIVTPLRVASQPTFAAISREGGRAAALLLTISRVTGVVAFPVFAGLAVLALPLLHVVFGLKWDAAAPVLSILSIVGAYFCIDKVQQAYCLAAGQPGRITVLSWVNVALGAGLSLAALPFGVTGVALAVVAGYLLPWPLRVGVTARVAGLRPMELVAPFVRPLVATAAMAAVVYLVRRAIGPDHALPALVAGTLAGAVTMLVLGMIFLRDLIFALKSLMMRPKPAPDRDP